MTDNYCVNEILIIGSHFSNIDEGLEKQSVNGVKLKTISHVYVIFLNENTRIKKFIKNFHKKIKIRQHYYLVLRNFITVNIGLVCFMVFNATFNYTSVISWRSA